MSDVRLEYVPSLLLHMVPESAGPIREKYGSPAEQAVRTEDVVLDIYDVLLDCFSRPVLLHQLISSAPDAKLLERCFAFVDRVLHSSSDSVLGAVHFNVLEQFLLDESLIRAAFPRMKETTREHTLQMLDSYETLIPGVNDK